MMEGEDTRCQTCGGPDSDEGNEMLICQGPQCLNAHHLQCLHPPLSCVPDDVWLCPVCTARDDIGIPVSILSHRGNGNQRKYQVRWQSGEETFEPRDHLMNLPVLQAYEKSMSGIEDAETCSGAGSSSKAGGKELPPGWTTVSNQTPSGRCLSTYFSPEKFRARSIVEAWRIEAWRMHEASSKDPGPKLPSKEPASSKKPASKTPSRKSAVLAQPAPPIPPTAPSRKRLVRLPEPVDEKVGKRLKVALTDEEAGCRWFSAKVLEAHSCLANFSNSKVEYVIQFDYDLHKLTVDLADLPFQWMHDDEESDECKVQAVLSLPRSHAHKEEEPVETPAMKRSRKSSRSNSAGPATSAQASQTDASLLGSDASLRTDPVSRLVSDVMESVLAGVRDRALSAADDLPIMRPLRSIEWFAGSARLTFALRRNHGWNHAVIHDFDSSKVEWELHGSHAEKDTFRCDEFLEEVSLRSLALEPCYDYFHFSIDCSSFSGLGFAGQSRNDSNDFLGAGASNMASCSRGNRMVHKTVDLIAAQLERNPRFLFTIENPFPGRLKDHPMIHARLEAPREHGGLGAVRVVVDYCWFFDQQNSSSRPFKKRTIFWTNSPTMIREFGVHAPPASCSYYLCERSTPCPCYNSHRAVTSATAAEATPFPRLLAEKIARCISLDATSQRWRPVRL